MKVSNVCPRCKCRVWRNPDPTRISSRWYSPPRWFKDKIIAQFGYYPFRRYYKSRCEICHTDVAVFPNNRRDLKDYIVVVYNCTFNTEPVDSEVCNERKSCYGCPIKGNGNVTTEAPNE